MELNEKIREKQMSENFILGIMLALTGGFLDAYTLPVAEYLQMRKQVILFLWE